MNPLRRISSRLRDPDTHRLRDLGRIMSRAILIYAVLSCILFLLFALASTAPHPLSLFVGDLARALPLLFHIISLLFLVLIALLAVMRISVWIKLRKGRY